MQCPSLNKDVPSILYKGALIPAATVCQIISEAVLNKTSLDSEFVQLITQYLPPPVSHYVEPTPNIFLWGGYSRCSTDEKLREFYDLTTSWGANSLSTNQGDLTSIVNPLTSQLDNERLDRVLRMQDEYNLPIHMNGNFGIFQGWKGLGLGPVLERKGYSGSVYAYSEFTSVPQIDAHGNSISYYGDLDACAEESLELLHPNIVDFANTKGGMEALCHFQHTDPAGSHAHGAAGWGGPAAEYFWDCVVSQQGGTCPDPAHPENSSKWQKNYYQNTEGMKCINYRGSIYTAAMEKFDELIKWLRPIGVIFDMEHYIGAGYADWWCQIFTYTDLGYPTWYDSRQVQTLNNCPRCAAKGNGDGIEGYYQGMLEVSNQLASIVKQHNGSAAVLQYGSMPTGESKYDVWWPYANSGFTHPNSSLYSTAGILGDYAGILPDYPTDPVDKFYWWRENGLYWCPDLYWAVQPDAIRNSYPWTSQYKGGWGGTVHSVPIPDWGTAGNYTYHNSEEFYALCFTLAKEGAKGISMWPAWTGVNSPNYITDDAVAAALIPVGIKAFKDYHYLYG